MEFKRFQKFRGTSDLGFQWQEVNQLTEIVIFAISELIDNDDGDNHVK